MQEEVFRVVQVLGLLCSIGSGTGTLASHQYWQTKLNGSAISPFALIGHIDDFFRIKEWFFKIILQVIGYIGEV